MKDELTDAIATQLGRLVIANTSLTQQVQALQAQVETLTSSLAEAQGALEQQQS